MTIKEITNLSEIANNYSGFMVDLWGVMHDGVSNYPSSVECLRALNKLGKKVIFLTNAPRRKIAVEANLVAKKTPRDLYIDVVSSGELLINYLSSPGVFDRYGLNQNCYFVGPERDIDIVKNTNLNLVSDPADASFLLVVGFDDNDYNLSSHQKNLDIALTKNIPLFCANPDIMVIKQGKKLLCAGAIADHYQNMGGKVHYFGKPYQQIYHQALKILNLPIDQILAIGDSFSTDIKGANNFGCDSLLIASGIHKTEILSNESLDSYAVAKMSKENSAMPNYVMDYLRW